MKQAFSLVELSIVLVILGLLTGGILGGQSLIRAAELRAVSTEHSRWLAASQTFRDKYFQLPGDLNNAQSFWTGPSSGTCPTATLTGTQTCNGNGDGFVSAGGNGNEAGEMFTYWQHLANAGLIEGNYSGKAGTGSSQHAVMGTNVPRSKMGGLGWSIQYMGVITNANFMDAGDYGNVLFFGGDSSSNKTFAGTNALKPEEAWNIDTKMDDGKPGTGKVMTLKTTSPSWGTGCATNDLADSTNNYALTNANKACPLIFPGYSK
jgi:prepilin-type N-terminal cleavage/methylation domain-containing protein